MQTSFTAASLQDPDTASSATIIRKCVHCGFCTATCPTFVLLGDELDSPRGRIYLMKEMLETQQKPTAEVVKHIDRCLSCLSCMTTCPSGVNYMHLVDHVRAYIEQNYRRPLRERIVRAALGWVLPHPNRFRLALHLARWSRPAAPLAVALFGEPMAAMFALAPRKAPAPAAPSRAAPAAELARGRIAMLQGCAEPVLRPEIRAAAVRLLSRHGFEVVFVAGEGCCGALTHHLGQQAASLAAVRRNVDVWTAEIEARGLDAIVVTASGCGTTLKDYGFMLRDDPAYAEKAARVSALSRDISEILATAPLASVEGRGLTVAYHSACSLQHGQQINDLPKRLLAVAGFNVRSPAEGHLCCGSAGVYNVLQPKIAGQLRDRKLANIDVLAADVIAAGNIGCIVQLGQAASVPIVHTVELLDWATGGPLPLAMAGLSLPRSAP
jgi:glycolate oxidase iron-sulfur subunit